ATLAFRFSQLAGLAPGFQSFIYSRVSGLSPTQFVARQISAHGCRDVLLYLAGGVYFGPAAVNVGMEVNVPDPLHQDVTPASVRAVVRAPPNVDFELVLDAPHTAAFQALEAIGNRAARSAAAGPRAHVLLVAAPRVPGGGSFTYLPEARVGGRLVANDTNPLHVLQLTDRLAYGLRRVA